MSYKVTSENLNKVENILNCIFPPIFKSCLLEINTSELSNKSGEIDGFELLEFLPTYDIKKVDINNDVLSQTFWQRQAYDEEIKLGWTEYEDLFPKGAVVIARNVGFDALILIPNTVGNLDEIIYLWDNVTGEVIKIADSLEELT